MDLPHYLFRLRVFLIVRGSGLGYAGRRLLVALVSLSVALVAAELLSQWLLPESAIVATERMADQIHEDRAYEADPVLGYRPRLGPAARNRGPFGALRNDYPIAKRPGVTRLLFIGDSVTRRGKIVEALRCHYGDERFEYWNAGVEGYNTTQELDFYRRYNRGIVPDHVILTAHFNDLEPNPVVVRFWDGRVSLHRPQVPAAELNSWLFRNSHLYRVVASRRLRPATDDEDRLRQLERTTRAGLVELAAAVARDGATFTVLIHPELTDPDRWAIGERRIHQFWRTALDQAHVRYFDLVEPLAEALRDGVQVQQDPPDAWHPSDEASEYFARYLVREGLLEP